MTVSANAQKVASALSDSAMRLKAIWGPVKRFLTFSPADDSIARAKNVSVSIQGGSVSVAYATRILSRIRIKGFRTYPVEGRYPAPEAVASSVSMALSSLHASNTDVTLCIPKSWAVIKTVEFPSTVRDSLSNVVSYEMDRLTPFAREEALYDFRILKEEIGKISLLVVAARADLINPYIEALREMGCNVTKVTLNLSGMGTLCSYSLGCADALFLDVGENEYEAALLSGGTVTAASAGDMGTGDERSQVEIILREIELLMGDASKKNGSPQIVLSLKGSSAGLREILKVNSSRPFKILEEGAASGLLSGKIPHEVAGGVVESLWPGARGLNLLEKGMREKVRTPVTLSVILVAAILAIWVISVFMPVSIEEKRLAEIKSEIATRKEQVKKVDSLKKEVAALEKEISVVNDFKHSRPMALDLIKELTSILPKKTWLSRMRITDTTVEIEGYSTSATELLPKLEASKYFKKVEFASPTFRDMRMNAERFNIKMEIEGTKTEEPKQPVEGKQPAEAKQSGTVPAKSGKGAVKK